jgi:hypothetical protein
MTEGGVTLNLIQGLVILSLNLKADRSGYQVGEPFSGDIAMKGQVILIAILVVLAALCMPMLLGIFGAVAGIVFGVLVALGALFLVGFILTLVFSGVGILAGGVLGLVGVILLAVAFPILAPVFLVLLPIIILIKLVS